MKAADNGISTTAARPASTRQNLPKNRFKVVFFPFLLVVGCSFLFSNAASAMSTNGSSSNNSGSAPAGTNAAEVAKSTIDFLTMARGLKTTPRTGWIRQRAGPRIESVADHSWRMSLMAMVAASSASSEQQSYDVNRCVKIALVHDLAEATVGDITPHCGVSDATKHELELAAITSMTDQLSGNVSTNATSPVAADILELWKEYEAGETPEAKLVKDMDKLEMILQALEYETDGKNEDSLDGFFDSTRNKWRTPIGKAWGEEIERRRTTKKTQSEKSPTTSTEEATNTEET